MVKTTGRFCFPLRPVGPRAESEFVTFIPPPPFVQANTNGRLHDAAEASLSPLNRGFLYGDAVYEVWRTYNRILFGWEEHWERLLGSAEALSIRLPLSMDALLAQIKRTVAAYEQARDHPGDFYVRLQVYRGEGAIGLDPRLADQAGFVILVQPVPLLSAAHWESGMKLTVSQTFRRNPPQALNPAWKTGNYLNSLLGLHEAKGRGADDVVFLNLADEVTEASTSNLALISGRQWITPPLSAGMLAGVTRRLILDEVAAAAGLEPVERSLRVEDLAAMDECMLLSSTKDVQPVGAVDGLRFRVAEGSRTRDLKRAFADYVNHRLQVRPDLSV